MSGNDIDDGVGERNNRELRPAIRVAKAIQPYGSFLQPQSTVFVIAITSSEALCWHAAHMQNAGAFRQR